MNQENEVPTGFQVTGRIDLSERITVFSVGDRFHLASEPPVKVG
jgi:hypothetical protein